MTEGGGSGEAPAAACVLTRSSNAPLSVSPPQPPFSMLYNVVLRPDRRTTVRLAVVLMPYVYIMTNRAYGTLYIGVTNNMARRAWEHRDGIVEGFTKQHALKRLVYYEAFESITDAIRREKRLKRWNRAWKIALIEAQNPNWEDLFPLLV